MNVEPRLGVVELRIIISLCSEILFYPVIWKEQVVLVVEAAPTGGFWG